MKRIQKLSVALLLASALFLSIGAAIAQSNNNNGMVRLVYFLPNDRPARPDRVRALRQLIKDAQEFYADEMERHGYGRKTFTLETNRRGVPVVHRVNGRYNEDHYYQTSSFWKVWAELPEHFDDFQHAYLVALDLSYEDLDDGTAGGLAGHIFSPRDGAGRLEMRGPEIVTQGDELLGGLAIIPTHGHNFDRLGLTAHEIGHAFGLEHDFREGRNSDYVLAAAEQNRLSKCAADWLSVSRFFNTKPARRNAQGNIQLVAPPSFSRKNNAIRLRFQVTDSDGLHQAQLVVPEVIGDISEGPYHLLECKSLKGRRATIEFLSEGLTVDLVDRITLQIIDVNGNITWATFLIDIEAVLPPPKVVSIPDRNLAQAVREALGLGRNTRITDRQMLSLRELNATDKKIKSLTGLEHATQLTYLFLYENKIRSLKPLSSLTKLRVLGLDENQVRNVRPIAGLISLEVLHIGGNQLNNADVKDLSGLTELRGLSLYSNQIRNIKPLANLSKLDALFLNDNKIRDVSPLSGLTTLQVLHLRRNEIRDVSPLAGLLNLESLHLGENSIQDFSPLANLKKLKDVDFSSSLVLTASGPKIEGPWLWMIVSTGRKAGARAATSGKDYLSVATKGSVTEEQIAVNGATAEDRVKNRKWTPGSLAPTGGDNITEVVRTTGLAKKWNIDNHVAYGSIALRSPRKQKTTMYVGSDDAVKVWLNGELVHDNPVDRASEGYQDFVPVTLKKGKNILLVAIYEAGGTWSGFFGFENDAVYSILTPSGVDIAAAPLNNQWAATPDATELLANYPNPFNPETWIPYQLSEPTEVTLHIYATDGRLIRTLTLGHQPAGTYQSKSRAAYWDGRNNLGEPVASGVYFYTLTAGDFSATRKMLIRK